MNNPAIIAYVHTEKASHKLDFKEGTTFDDIYAVIKYKRFPHPVRQLVVLKVDGTFQQAAELKQRICETCNGRGFIQDAFNIEDQKCTQCKGSGIVNEKLGTSVPKVDKIVAHEEKPLLRKEED